LINPAKKLISTRQGSRNPTGGGAGFAPLQDGVEALKGESLISRRAHRTVSAIVGKWARCTECAKDGLLESFYELV
jgi:hypothetical protein